MGIDCLIVELLAMYEAYFTVGIASRIRFNTSNLWRTEQHYHDGSVTLLENMCIDHVGSGSMPTHCFASLEYRRLYIYICIYKGSYNNVLNDFFDKE